MRNWYIYILRCADQSLYTGVTNDLERRLEEHNNGCAAARYTRGRRPVSLVYFETAANRSIACRREYQIKQLNRLNKQKLLANFNSQM
jgi:putative endonuclease